MVRESKERMGRKRRRRYILSGGDGDDGGRNRMDETLKIDKVNVLKTSVEV